MLLELEGEVGQERIHAMVRAMKNVQYPYPMVIPLKPVSRGLSRVLTPKVAMGYRDGFSRVMDRLLPWPGCRRSKPGSGEL